MPFYVFRYISASLLAGVLVLASCAPAQPAGAPSQSPPGPSGQAPAQATAAPKPSPAAQPQRGGTLTISTGADVTDFDIHQNTSISLLQPLVPAYNMLVQYDPGNPSSIVGDLAESWSLSSDGLTYTFKLRPGITFHDGQPMTVDDVVYNMQRMADPPKGVRSGRKEQFRTLDKIEKVNESTMRIVFKEPYGSFMAQFATDWFVIFPKSLLEKKGDMKKDVVGTGPFMLKSYTPGISLELVRYDKYFKKDMPYLDGVTTYIIKDQSTRFAAFRTGQVLMTGRIFAALSPSEARTVEKDYPNLVLKRFSGLQGPWFVFNTKRKPFDDVRVRRAIFLALDRDAMLKVIGEGEGVVGGFLSPGEWTLSEKEMRQTAGYRIPKAADIAEAKKLLAEAGYPNGFDVPTGFVVRDLVQRPSEFFAGQLQPLGISMKLEVMETTAQSSRTAKRDFAITAQFNASRINDPDELFRKYITNADQAYGDYSDPDVDRLLVEQGRAFDPVKRRQLLLQLSQRLEETAPAISPYWENTILGLWPQVRGFTPPPSGSYMLNRYENIWLAAK